MEISISVCMIVKNEEKYLENCLESIKNLASEIIIVDTGSTDNTKEIAKKYTDKVYEFSWTDNFSDARNFSLSKATKDWILSLDADEIISKQDQEKIIKIISEDITDAFLFNWRDYTNRIGLSGWISSKDDNYIESNVANGYLVSKVLRLFKRKENHYFEGRIHETVQNSIKNAGNKIYDSDIVIHHYGNLDKEKYSTKKIEYIELLKKRLEDKDFNEKKEDYICYEIASQLTNSKEYDEAIKYMVMAIKLKEEPKYLATLGSLYLIKKRYSEAERILKKAVEKDPKNASIHGNLGIIYSEREEFIKAIKKFEKAITLNPKSADSYFNLGIVYKRMGKENKKEEMFEKAVYYNPIYKNYLEKEK
ncbi:MAG: glycosyltransferase [Candidatus Pacearchaeota archaeon]|jgi:glycosyltransferase involved in cell wall biosynthesis